MNVKRGDVFTADLGWGVGSEQGGYRPVLVVQNNKGNSYSTTTIIAPLTSKKNKQKLPTHILLPAQITKTKWDCLVLCEQIRCIDTSRLGVYVSTLDDETMVQVDKALAVATGLPQIK